MKRLYFLFAATLLLSVTSCKDDDNGDASCSYENQTAQGTLLGSAWEMREGTASSFDDEYQVYLYGTDEITFTNICTFSAIDLTSTQVTFFVDGTTGEESLSVVNPVTIYNASTFGTAIATSGCVNVRTISADQIQGEISFNQGGEVLNGEFTVSICD